MQRFTANWPTHLESGSRTSDIRFVAYFSAYGVRHPVYVRMSEDKIADQVVKDVPDPERERKRYRPLPAITS